jgi:hypothetical protein
MHALDASQTRQCIAIVIVTDDGVVHIHASVVAVCHSMPLPQVSPMQGR